GRLALRLPQTALLLQEPSSMPEAVMSQLRQAAEDAARYSGLAVIPQRDIEAMLGTKPALRQYLLLPSCQQQLAEILETRHVLSVRTQLPAEGAAEQPAGA